MWHSFCRRRPSPIKRRSSRARKTADFKIIYARAALADLDEIIAWSWENHAATTERFAIALLNQVDLLRNFPHLGQPVKGFFLFFLSILVLPYLINLVDAYRNAARLKRAGKSTGCSGFIWVGLQIWLAANTALLVALGLTVAGVLK